MTSAPFTYAMVGMDLKAPRKHIARVAAAPPHVLHGGLDAPIDNAWGAFSPIESDDVTVFPPRLSENRSRLWSRLVSPAGATATLFRPPKDEDRGICRDSSQPVSMGLRATGSHGTQLVKWIRGRHSLSRAPMWRRSEPLARSSFGV